MAGLTLLLDEPAAPLEAAQWRGPPLVPRDDTRRMARSIMAQVEGGIMLAKLNNDPEVVRQIGRDVMRLIGAPADSAGTDGNET